MLALRSIIGPATPIVVPAAAGIRRAAHRSALRTARWAIL